MAFARSDCGGGSVDAGRYSGARREASSANSPSRYCCAGAGTASGNAASAAAGTTVATAGLGGGVRKTGGLSMCA